MRIQLWSFVIVVTVCLTLPANADRDCGSASIVAGNSCDNLFVTFDLKGCTEIEKIGDAIMKCNGNEGEATLETAKFRYSVKVKMSGENTWQISGAVHEKSKSGKTESNIELKSKIVPKPVAVVPTVSQAPAMVPTVPPAVTVPAPGFAQNLTVKGSMRARWQEDARATDLLTIRNYTLLRGRIDLTYAVNPKFTAFAQPQFAKTYGEKQYVPSSGTTNLGTEASGNNFDTNLDMHQMYMEFRSTPNLIFTVGRQILSYGNELLIGKSDWHNIGRAFDGAKIKLTHSLGSVDIFGTKLVDNDTNTSTPADLSRGKDLYGAYSATKLHDSLKNFDLYILQKKDTTTTTAAALTTMSYGTRLQSDISFFDYRAEYTQQKARSIDASQYDVEVGISAKSHTLKPRLALEASKASKDFDQLYPTPHKWLGYADVLGRRNITSYAAHLSGQFQAFTLGIDYHVFERESVSKPAYKLNGSTTLGSTAASDSLKIGSEIDVTLGWNFDPNMSLTAGYAKFSPGAYLNEQATGKVSIGSYYLTLESKF